MRTQPEGAAVKRRGGSYDLAGMRIHLIGVGGSGMSGAATLLLKLGATVTGSDRVGFDGLGSLVRRGARVSIGHRQELVESDVDLVVASAAIPEDNPELAAARARGVPVINYARLLGMLMARCARGVAIAGTHGKSTTTAMCAHVFRQAGLRPSFLIGARCEQLGGSSDLGEGPHFIAESCEFNRSFLELRPHSAAVLNIEPDHLDCYRDLDEIVAAFALFCERIEPDGLLVCNADDDRAAEAGAATSARIETFGFQERADWRAVHLRADRGAYAFDVVLRGTTLFTTRLSVSGRYNVANALAVAALAHHAGADPETVSRALSEFRGVCRRMTWRGEGRGITIIDDYAHHPTEVRVTIEAARHQYRPKRTWVIFQPHQHARTRHFMDAFAESLADADEIIVPDIYGARDSGQPGEQSGSAKLAARIRQNGGRARYVPDLCAVADHVVNHLEQGDLVLTMGAGDVWKVADELVARICRRD